MHVIFRIILSAALVLTVGRLHAADRTSNAYPQHDPRNYKPPTFPDADCFLQQKFLPDARDWERIDVYVPKNPKDGARDGKLPCVVLFYGGGWGGKVAGGMAKEMKALLDRGYVVAMPDYVLGAETPVPQAIWDGGEAIRYLRKNAARYRIDPDRIGGWGFSAGGWLVQNLAPSDFATLVPLEQKGVKRTVPFYLPMLNPRWQEDGTSPRLQVFVTDWGAGVVAKNRIIQADGGKWLDARDPPMLTCHNDLTGKFPAGAAAYKAAGAIAEVVVLDVKNTHVPSGDTPAKAKDGTNTTWCGRTLDFFDHYVKNARPEQPPAASKAVWPRSCRIKTAQLAYSAKVGEKFEVKFDAEGAAATTIEWAIAGKTGTTKDTHNPPRPIPAFAIDPRTGLLSGTPETPGTCVFLVGMNMRGGNDDKTIFVDAVSISITVAAKADTVKNP